MGRWRPYLSERQWGTVREDYSTDGNAWAHFSHEQSHYRVYRWGEDGLAGVSDDKQRLCFALSLWNGADPVLKERLFCLTNSQGDFTEKFSDDPATFREKKIAPFYAFDARELRFRRGGLEFEVRKDSSGTWVFGRPLAGRRPVQEKFEGLLAALADCEAKEFIDGPKYLPVFTVRAALKTEDPADPQKTGDIVMEFSDASDGTAIARNPALPYCFRVGREILDKFPAKIDDIAEEIPKTAEKGK